MGVRGENSRWRDLVRTNTYGEELVYSFLRYYSIGMQGASGPTGYEDAIVAHDSYCDNPNYINTIQGLLVYYHPYKIDEANKTALITNMRNQLYGYQVSGGNVLSKYPNQTLPSLRIYNAYSKATSAPTLSYPSWWLLCYRLVIGTFLQLERRGYRTAYRRV